MPDNTFFERGMKLYPQPVAYSCTQICQATTLPERLDAVLKCAEVTTRYAAILVISAFSARSEEHENVAAPGAFGDFKGNLSFGHFRSVLEGLLAANIPYPLKEYFKAAFASRGSTAFGNMQKLIILRNNLAHSPHALTPAIAENYFNDPINAPDQLLQKFLSDLHPLLNLPLFLIENQRPRQREKLVNRLLLMGASSDPYPDEMSVSDFFSRDKTAYVGGPTGALSLYPFIVWGLAESNFSLFMIHSIETRLHYRNLQNKELTIGGESLQSANDMLSGKLVPLEQIQPSYNRSFAMEWQEKSRLIEASLNGPMPWNDLDKPTLRWYATRLDPAANPATHNQLIVTRLLDGRQQLSSFEIKQMRLLFGREQVVRSLLGRDLLDCRLRKNEDSRFDERITTATNVLQGLRSAVEFFSKHVAKDIEEIDLDGLQTRSGSADYIAMREGLVNMFIHQDYSDSQTVAQIFIDPDQSIFTNAGRSLVEQSELKAGRKSQSRNPLISRALTLIGFAELAGSGLYIMRNAWLQEKRRLPIYKSDPESNTFTLTLDWRAVEFDSFWKDRHGMSLTPFQVQVLILAAEPGGVSAGKIVIELTSTEDEANKALDYLDKQGILKKDGISQRFDIPEYLRDSARLAKQLNSAKS